MPKEKETDMQVIYCGANRRKGVSQKTGNSYDICEVSYLVETKPKTTDAYVYTGHGHEVRTFPLNPTALADFQDLELGAEISLEFGPKPDSPMRNWVTGIE